MSLSVQEIKKIQKALIDAFPTRASLEQMLIYELDKNLTAIAGGSTLQDINFKLIQTAEAEGWIENLVRAACKSNPENLQLRAIAKEILPNHVLETPSVSSHKIPQIQSNHLQKILILAANPTSTTRLRLGEEVREIDARLRQAKHRTQFILEQKWAVRPRDIHRAMLDINPQIVHFSGHGMGDEGLVFEDETGSAKLVDSEALAGLFDLFADQIECVVLNGCYSETQAEAISQHINYVIGMSKAIGDKAAIEFAVGFYDALGSGRSVEFAYKFGCTGIGLADIPEQLTPILKKKPNIEERVVSRFAGDSLENQLPLLIPSLSFSNQELTNSHTLKISNINTPSINSYTFWKKGKYVIVFACGGTFFGSLTGYTFISIIGALIGGIYGFVFNDSSNSDSNNNFLSKGVILPKNLFKRGEHMIALASGGAFIGGIIAQIPGSIVGALAGAIFSLFTMDKII